MLTNLVGLQNSIQNVYENTVFTLIIGYYPLNYLHNNKVALENVT